MTDVTLTFDNGPEPDVTPGVLDVLAGEGIGATFFVLGRNLDADPRNLALMRRAASEGHWIGNHTYSHETPLGLDTRADAPAAEIARTEALIGSQAGAPPLFRPFGGGGHLGPHLLSPAARDHLAAGGYTVVLWNAVPRDWEDPDGWPETAMAQIAAVDHALVVLHDLPTGAMRHLARFVGMVRDAGGRFRQDFPDDCLAMVGGEARPALAGSVAAG